MRRLTCLVTIALMLTASSISRAEDSPAKNTRKSMMISRDAGNVMLGCTASCTTSSAPAVTYTCSAGAGGECKSDGKVATCKEASNTETCKCNPNEGCK
jgi:hypothetical protein